MWSGLHPQKAYSLQYATSLDLWCRLKEVGATLKVKYRYFGPALRARREIGLKHRFRPFLFSHCIQFPLHALRARSKYATYSTVCTSFAIARDNVVSNGLKTTGPCAKENKLMPSIYFSHSRLTLFTDMTRHGSS